MSVFLVGQINSQDGVTLGWPSLSLKFVSSHVVIMRVSDTHS